MPYLDSAGQEGVYNTSGSVTLSGAAINGNNTLSDAGAINGVSYIFKFVDKLNPSNWEVRTAKFNDLATDTLDTFGTLLSSNGTIADSTTVLVFQVLHSSDLNALAPLTELSERTPTILNGFVDRTDVVFSWDDVTRTISLTPAVSSFDVYSGDNRLTFSSVQSFQISDVEGSHFVYIDSSGVMQETSTFLPALINTDCFVAYIYWDATNSKAVPDAIIESHGVDMDHVTHAYLHNTVGTVYQSGLALSATATGNGDSDSDIQFSAASGNIWDEDIPHTIDAKALAGTFKLLYRSGAAGYWRADTTNLIAKLGTDRAVFNEWTGATWQLTEVVNNDYLLAHVFAIPGVSESWMVIIGQNQYTTLTLAQTAALSEVNTISTGDLPVTEFLPVATFIIQTSTGYSNSISSRIVQTADDADYIDWRTNSPVGGSGTSSDHNSSTGLQGGTIDEYYHLTEEDYGNRKLAFSLSAPIGGNVNAVANTHYRYDCTNLVADLNIVIPAGASNQRIDVSTSTGHSTYYVTIAGDTGVTIDQTPGETMYYGTRSDNSVVSLLCIEPNQWVRINADSGDIGTKIQGYDPELAALAALLSDAGRVPYFNGVESASYFNVIDANTTITVAASGGDFTTILDAYDSLDGKTILPWVTVTISVAAGTINETATINLDHPQWSQIQIIGASAATTTITFASGIHGFQAVEQNSGGYINNLTINSAATSGTVFGAYAYGGGKIKFGGDVTISGGWWSAATAENGGLLLGSTITLDQIRLYGIRVLNARARFTTVTIVMTAGASYQLIAHYNSTLLCTAVNISGAAAGAGLIQSLYGATAYVGAVTNAATGVHTGFNVSEGGRIVSTSVSLGAITGYAVKNAYDGFVFCSSLSSSGGSYGIYLGGGGSFICSGDVTIADTAYPIYNEKSEISIKGTFSTSGTGAARQIYARVCARIILGAVNLAQSNGGNYPILLEEGSELVAIGLTFTGSTTVAFARVLGNSKLYAYGSTVSGSCSIGYEVVGSTANVGVSVISGATTYCIACGDAAIVNADGCHLDNAAYGILATGSCVISANYADFTDISQYPISASRGALIGALSANINGTVSASECVFASDGAKVVVRGLTMSQSAGNAFNAAEGSVIVADFSTVTGTYNYGFLIQSASLGSFANSSIANCTYGVIGLHGSKITANVATITNCGTANYADNNSSIYALGQTLSGNTADYNPNSGSFPHTGNDQSIIYQ